MAFLPMTGTRGHSIAVAVNWLGQAGLSGMSMTGGYAGTPVFMPREQITNFKYVKPASDVWSMGFTECRSRKRARAICGLEESAHPASFHASTL